MKSPITYQAELRTPFGVVGIHCEDEKLIDIVFLAPDSAEQASQDKFVREVCAQLDAYFKDSDFQFDLPLRLAGTEHQRKVWQAMCNIPRGVTRSYGELAAELKSAAQAVGQACGANPIPIIIPCHRVVGKTGLGGFMHHNAGYALDIKRWLLVHEGVI